MGRWNVGLQGAAQDGKWGGSSRRLPGWGGPEVQELQRLPACWLPACHQDCPLYMTRLIPFLCDREELKLNSFPLFTGTEVNTVGKCKALRECKGGKRVGGHRLSPQ